MELSVQIIRAGEFVRVTPRGDLDFKSAKKMLLEALATTSASVSRDFLIDCRMAAIHMTLADVTNLVEAITRSRHLFRGKLAFLPPDDEGYKVIKFLEIYASNRGFQVTVFEEYEQAMNWLMPPSMLPPASNAT